MSIATLDTVEDASFEVVSGGALQAISHAETDVQIATAKKYPRSISAFKQLALDMATLDEETAASCFYTVPRGGKKIKGESIRLAEIASSAWGNLQAGSRIIDDDGKMVTAQGFAWDLQRNYRVSVEVQRRVTGKDGKRFSDDMIIITCNAAAAIAFRNAVFKVIPKAYIRPIYLAAVKVAVGDAKTLVAKRDECIAYFAKMGVDADKVLAAVEKRAVEDVGLDDLATLKGMATAIKDGELSIDEAFPDAAKEKKAAAVLGALKENGHANGNGAKFDPVKEKATDQATAPAE